MKYTGSSLLITLLERQGIEILSGIPGGAILPLYDALYDSKICHILARHEQGAGFIAQGMARSTGQPAVCLATSGPGATNLITAIADAYLDSVPLIAITAQVSQNLIGTDAFQEVDTYGLTLPITKHNFLVRNAEDLLTIIPLAFQIAQSGRPGPVSIDIPKDVLQASIEIAQLPQPGRRLASPLCSDEDIQAIAHLISLSERPLLLLGGGVIQSNASELALQLAEQLQAPVLTTLMGIGCLPAAHPLNMGMPGMHGAMFTHQLLGETDLLIAIGSRFDDRTTGKVCEFCPQAVLIHIDIDQAELGKIKTPHISIAADAGTAIACLLKMLPRNISSKTQWSQRAIALKQTCPLSHPAADKAPLNPINLCQTLASILPDDAIITTDVGQHQMWVAQSWPVNAPRTLLTSGGLGTMGFGLPAAIGAALANWGKRIVCITGDGSILMNIQELATLVEHQLPVAIFVFNNQNLGLVRQQQNLFYKQRYSASAFTLPTNFAAIAHAFGIPAVNIDATHSPALQIKDALASAEGPILFDIPIDADEQVLPMVPPGAANHHAITR